MGMEEMTVRLLAFFGLPGTVEWVIILLAALLIFGRRLPDVARSVGKSIVEFKKGVRDVKADIDTQSRLESTESAQTEQPGAAPSSAATSGQPSPTTSDRIESAPTKSNEVIPGQ